MKRNWMALLFCILAGVDFSLAQVPDSSYCFWYDLSIEFWENQNRRFYEYNADEIKTSEIKQNWDASENDWENQYKYSWNFNDQNHLVEYKVALWDDEWIYDSKETFAYNDNGFITLWTYHFWDIEEEQWTGIEQYTYDFDEFGNEILKIYNEWSDSQEMFINLYKWSSTYSNNKISIRIFQEKMDEEWVNKSRYVYSYTEQNLLQSVVKQNWNSNQNKWDSENKTAYEYNVYGSLTERKDQLWNAEINIWENVVRTIFNYQLDTLVILEEWQEWDTEFEAWVGEWRNEFTYDNRGNKASFVYSLYNKTTDDWEFITKSEYGYFPDNAISEIINYSWNSKNQFWDKYYRTRFIVESWQHVEMYETWDTIRNDWIFQNKCVDYYPWPASLSSLNTYEQIKIYPNPTKHQLFFSANNNQSERIRMYNIAGQLVLETLVNQNSPIHIESLETGTYLVQFLSGNKIVSVNKLIIR